jgi:ADP-dependent NAD(P)H-hydrate dehydratase / NAD(P)H-hydrate epimerase
MRVVTSKEMRDIDALAVDKYKIPSIVLMEHAGLRAAEIIAQKQKELGWHTEILVFAGKGKNGGDALVVARQLVAMGKRVRLFLLHGTEAYKDESKQNLEILLTQKIRPITLDNVAPLEQYFASASGPFLVVDGLLGIGFKGSLVGLYADVVDIINAKANYTIALDIPTGVDATTGATIGQAIYADATVAFGFAKLGHFIFPGAINRGELAVVDIALPPRFRKEGGIHALTPDNIAPLLIRRDRYGHKNSFGHTLLIGGSVGKIGSIAMAAKACIRVGAGLATVATWEDSFELLMNRVDDEIMCMPLQFEEARYKKYQDDVKFYSSVVVGPGMGTGERAVKILRDLIDFFPGALVIDADGINILAAQPALKNALHSRKAPTILTPHPGEMSRLLKVSKQEVVDRPMDCVQRAAEETNAIVILKGATTFISPGDSHVYINHYPNDGMATAGSGDVLAGMIGGIVGQGMDPKDAVCLAVYVHSLSGDFASKGLGHRAMAASDIISHLGDAFLKLRAHREIIDPI